MVLLLVEENVPFMEKAEEGIFCVCTKLRKFLRNFTCTFPPGGKLT